MMRQLLIGVGSSPSASMFNVEVELPISSRIFLIDLLKLLIAAFADAEFINRDCICAYNRST